MNHIRSSTQVSTCTSCCCPTRQMFKQEMQFGRFLHFPCSLFLLSHQKLLSHSRTASPACRAMTCEMIWLPRQARVLSAISFEQEQAKWRCREEERKLPLPPLMENTASHLQIIHLQNGVMPVAQVISCKNGCCRRSKSISWHMLGLFPSICQVASTVPLEFELDSVNKVTKGRRSTSYLVVWMWWGKAR